MTKRVTVAIPFFNEERYLAQAIRSVLAQTWSDFDLRLVDDGSSDSSMTIARSFATDPRVQVSSDGLHKGLGARLNEITRRVSSELIARMDGDDVAHPSRLAQEIELLDRRRDCAAVGTWAALVDENETVFGIVEATPIPSARVAIERGLIAHATMVARRDWLLAYPYDEALTRAEDRDLWSRTVSTTSFDVVKKPLYVVRARPHDANFLSDYLESQRQHRIIFLRYGPDALGVARTIKGWATSHAKSVLMRGADYSGLAEHLVRRRGRPPTADEKQLALEALAVGREEITLRND